MSKIPYFRVPLSLMDDDIFCQARIKHQFIFLRMLSLAAYKPMDYDVRGHVITLEPGQLCYSWRKLAYLCGNECTKEDIEGAIRYFEKWEFLRQEVRHKKSVITITHPECYDLFKELTPPKSPPAIPPALRHKVDNNNTNLDVKKTMSNAQARTMLFSADQIPQTQHNSTIQTPQDCKIDKLPEKNHNITYKPGRDKLNPYKLSKIQLESLTWLKYQGIDTNEDTLSYWAKTYSLARLKDVYLAASMQSHTSLGAYMQKLLKSNAYVETDLTKANKELSLKFKELNGWNELKVGDRYVTCTLSAGYVKEIPLCYSTNVFQSSLEDLYSNFKDFSEA